MKKTRLVSIFMALVLLGGITASCGSESAGSNDTTTSVESGGVTQNPPR